MNKYKLNFSWEDPEFFIWLKQRGFRSKKKRQLKKIFKKYFSGTLIYMGRALRYVYRDADLASLVYDSNPMILLLPKEEE